MSLLRRLDPALLLFLLAAALLVRVAVPSGFMPVADQHGLRVEMCSGFGKTVIEIDPGTTGDQQQRDPCPFGLAAGPAFDVPPLPALPAPPPALAAQHWRGLTEASLVARRALRPPARGPPAFA